MDDFENLPLEERLTHKNWKARQGAYDELTKLVPCDPDLAKQQESKMKGFYNESNAVALDSALSAALACIQSAKEPLRGLSNTFTVLVEKCLAANKQSTRDKASEIVLLCVELEIADGLQEAVISGFSHKTPKIVAASSHLVTDIIANFGAKAFSPKPFLKPLLSLFEHRDKVVRTEAKSLVIEIYKWIGSAVLSFLSDLKPIQIKELQQEFDSLESKAVVPTRYLKSQKHLKVATVEENATDSNASVPSTASTPPVIDAYDLAEPVKFLSKLPKNFYNDLLSSKWKERKEALEALEALVNVPRIEPDNYGELIAALAKRLDDSNVLVVIAAANSIRHLANGLRAGFSTYKSQVISPLLERCKEKKQNVIDALKSALDALSYSISINDVKEEVLTSLKSKNPQVKTEALQWLIRYVGPLKQLQKTVELKPLADAILKAYDDSDANVRNVAAQSLGALLRLSPAKINPLIQNLDAIKKAKVLEFSGSAPPAPTTIKSEKKESKPTSPSIPVKRPATAKPKTEARKVTKPVSARPGTAAPKEAKTPEVTVNFQFTDDSALEYAQEEFGADIITSLADSNWKNRLAALTTILESKLSPSIKSEAISRALSVKPGWKENNFQVVNAMIKVFLTLASDSEDFSVNTVSLVAAYVIEKLGDAKIKANATECLDKFADKTGLAFVFKCINETILKQKAPKVISDMLAWLSTAIRQYGTEGIDSKNMIPVVKFGLANSNQTVRNQAVALCGSMRIFFGPAIRAPLQDLNAALLALIDAEFEKVISEPPPQIKKRTVNEVSRSSSATAVDVDVSSKKVEDNVMRDDISKLVTDEMIEKMNDGAWKVRKEGLDELADVLKRSRHIQANLPHEIFTALKSRLSDSNKMIVIQSLEIIKALASSIGAAFEKSSKLLLSSILLCLNDQKTQVRSAAVGAIQSISDSVGFESGLSFYGQALVPDMSNLRKELSKWMGENENCLKAFSSKSVDVSSIIHPILLCMLDKNAEVRKNSQICLKSILSNVGVKGVKSQISDHFKGIQLKTLTEALDSLTTQSVPTPTIVKTEPVSKPKSEPTEKKIERPVSKKSEVKETKEEKKPKSIPLIFADARLKPQRAEKNSGIYRWAFDSPRKDLMDFLRTQSDTNFSNDLHALLFSEGHFKEKDHLQGLQDLESFFKGTDESNTDPEQIMKLAVLSSDLILKYLTVRFYDTNTTMLLKALDVTEILLSLLEKQNYSLMEYEASSFLPHFLMKLGDAKDAIRSKVKSLLRQICKIYPVSKLSIYLLESLKSKNSRTRTECLDEIAHLIQRNGLTIFSNPYKAFPLVGQQVSERDAGVRNAALNVLVHTFAIAGDMTYKYVGRLSDKDRSLLDEKIRRSNVNEENRAVPTVKEAISAPIVNLPRSTGIKKEFSLDIDQIESSEIAAAVEIAEPIVRPLMPIRHETDDLAITLILTQLIDWNTQQSLEALRELEKIVIEFPERLRDHMNELIGTVSVQIKVAFTAENATNANMSRWAKLLMPTMIHILSVPALCKAIDKDVLYRFMEEILQKLLDPSFQSLDESSQLPRHFNTLMVKILDNGNRNIVFCLLLDLLERSAKKCLTLPPKDVARQSKLTELIMKCIWKLTKVLGTLLNDKELKADLLLLDIHKFFMASPPSEWKKRANERVIPQAEMPLRTVKTILVELVNIYGENIVDHLHLIDMIETSHVWIYLKNMLENSGKMARLRHASETSEPSIPMSPDLRPRTAPAISTPAKKTFKIQEKENAPVTPMSKEKLDQLLSKIFERIMSVDHSKLGIKELYDFQRKYPKSEALWNAYLDRTGDYFRGYISRGLESLVEGQVSPTKNEEDPSNYRNRLSRLQQMFTKDPTAIPTPTKKEIKPEPPKEETKRVEAKASGLQSIEALRERLAKMKRSVN